MKMNFFCGHCKNNELSAKFMGPIKPIISWPKLLTKQPRLGFSSPFQQWKGHIQILRKELDKCLKGSKNKHTLILN